MILAARLIAPAHRTISGFAMTLHPRGERGADVEIDRFVIVANVDDDALHRVRVRVGGIALAQNALVPICEWRGTGFRTDKSGPRIFARRLIKMAVNDQVTFLAHQANVALSSGG